MIKPTGNYCLLSLESEPVKGGIVGIEGDKRTARRAKVIAVGPGKLDERNLNNRFPMVVKQGDVVLIAPYMGYETFIEGKEHVVIEEQYIIGVVENA